MKYTWTSGVVKRLTKNCSAVVNGSRQFGANGENATLPSGHSTDTPCQVYSIRQKAPAKNTQSDFVEADVINAQDAARVITANHRTFGNLRNRGINGGYGNDNSAGRT
jgi:hypothetical protein